MKGGNFESLESWVWTKQLSFISFANPPVEWLRFRSFFLSEVDGWASLASFSNLSLGEISLLGCDRGLTAVGSF